MEAQERILSEATRQFFKNGIRAVTMDQIAAAIGISKRTIYETYQNKTQVIQCCLDVIIRQQEKRNHEVISASSNVIESVFTFMQQGITTINAINPVFFFDMKRFYADIWETYYEKSLTNGYNLTCRLLEQGISEGLFRENINIALISKLLREQINMISNEQLFPPGRYNYPDVFQNLIITFIRGISTISGISLIDNILDNSGSLGYLSRSQGPGGNDTSVSQ